MENILKWRGSAMLETNLHSFESDRSFEESQSITWRVSRGLVRNSKPEIARNRVRGVEQQRCNDGPLVYPRNKLQSQITKSNSFGVSRGMSQFQVCLQGFSVAVVTSSSTREDGKGKGVKMENRRPGRNSSWKPAASNELTIIANHWSMGLEESSPT